MKKMDEEMDKKNGLQNWMMKMMNNMDETWTNNG